MSRFQYQQLAETPPTRKVGSTSYWLENVSVDRWYETIPDQQRQLPKALLAAIQSGSFSFVESTLSGSSWAQSIPIDRYQPSYPDMLLPLKSFARHLYTEFSDKQVEAASGTGATVSWQELSDVSKWLGFQPGRLFQLRSLPTAVQQEANSFVQFNIPAAPALPIIIVSVYPDRLSSPLVYPVPGSGSEVLIGTPEAVSIDKFQPNYPDILLPKLGLHPVRGDWFETEVYPISNPPTFSILFYPSYPDRLSRPTLHVTQMQSFAFGQVFATTQPAEQINIDKWLPTYPDFVKGKPQLGREQLAMGGTFQKATPWTSPPGPPTGGKHEEYLNIPSMFQQKPKNRGY